MARSCGRKRLNWIGRATLVVVVSLALVTGCGKHEEAEKAPASAPRVSGLEVIEAAAASVADYYETSGTLMARTTSRVAPRMMGSLLDVLVREGELVTAGQVLARIDDRDVRQKIAAAEAAVAEAEHGLAAAASQKEFAETSLRRFEKLYEAKALTQHELDQARSGREIAVQEHARVKKMVERTRAGLAEASVYRDYAMITAPVSGVVTAKQAEVGSMAMPGMPLFTIEDNSSFTLDLWVSENMAGKVDASAPVQVATAAGSFAGKVLDAVPSIDPRSRTFLVKVAIEGQGLTSGMHAAARVPVGDRRALVVPQSSLVAKGNLLGVYVVGRDNMISYRLVRAGRVDGGMAEILTGLASGERIVVAGVDKAVDGGILVEGARQ